MKIMVKLINNGSNQFLDKLFIFSPNYNVCLLKDFLIRIYVNNYKLANQRHFESLFFKIFLHNIDASYCTRFVYFIPINDMNEDEYDIDFNEELDKVIVLANFPRINKQSIIITEEQIDWMQQAYKYYIKTLLMQESQFLDVFWSLHWLKRIQDSHDHNAMNSTTDRPEQLRYDGHVLNDDNFINNNFNNNIHEDYEELNNVPENNRDWLDNFYMLSRILILFSIVYFYSSPLRFILVVFLGFIIYLYHHGFLRNVIVIADNNRRGHNDQIVHNINNDPRMQRLQQDQHPNENGYQGRIDRSNQNRNERPNVLGFVWMFFSTFIASLIPDQPNII